MRHLLTRVRAPVIQVPGVAGPLSGWRSAIAGATGLVRSSAWSWLAAHLVLVALIAYAVGVSLITGVQRSLWLDEGITAWQVVLPLRDLFSYDAQFSLLRDVHPPLYALLLKGWVTFAGTSELGLRSFSALWVGVAVVGTYAFARAAYGQRAGLLAAAFVAGSPLVLWYGAEARMYAQLTALSCIAGAILLRLLGQPARRWFIVYGVVVGLTVFTHYFVVPLIVVQVLFAGAYWWTRTRDPRLTLRRFLTLCGAVSPAAIGLLAWIVVSFFLVGRDLSHGESDFLSAGIYTAFEAFGSFVWGLQPRHVTSLLLALWPLAMLPVMLLIRSIGRPGSTTALCIVSILVTTAFMYMMYLSGRVLWFDARYIMFVTPSLALLMGRLIAQLPMRAANLAFLLVLLMHVALIGQQFSPDNPKLYDYRTPFSLVGTHASPADVVVVHEPTGGMLLPITRYYGDAIKEEHGIPVIRATDPARIAESVPSPLAQRVWLITNDFNHDGTDDGFAGDPRALPGLTLLNQWSYPGVNLRLYAIDRNDTSREGG